MLNMVQHHHKVREPQAHVSADRTSPRIVGVCDTDKKSILTVGEKVVTLKKLPDALHEKLIVGSRTLTD